MNRESTLSFDRGAVADHRAKPDPLLHPLCSYPIRIHLSDLTIGVPKRTHVVLSESAQVSIVPHIAPLDVLLR